MPRKCAHLWFSSPWRLLRLEQDTAWVEGDSPMKRLALWVTATWEAPAVPKIEMPGKAQEIPTTNFLPKECSSPLGIIRAEGECSMCKLQAKDRLEALMLCVGWLVLSVRL